MAPQLVPGPYMNPAKALGLAQALPSSTIWGAGLRAMLSIHNGEDLDAGRVSAAGLAGSIAFLAQQGTPQLHTVGTPAATILVPADDEFHTVMNGIAVRAGTWYMAETIVMAGASEDGESLTGLTYEFTPGPSAYGAFGTYKDDAGMPRLTRTPMRWDGGGSFVLLGLQVKGTTTDGSPIALAATVDVVLAQQTDHPDPELI